MALLGASLWCLTMREHPSCRAVCCFGVGACPESGDPARPAGAANRDATREGSVHSCGNNRIFPDGEKNVGQRPPSERGSSAAGDAPKGQPLRTLPVFKAPNGPAGETRAVFKAPSNASSPRRREGGPRRTLPWRSGRRGGGGYFLRPVQDSTPPSHS